MPTPDAKSLGLREFKKVLSERIRDPNTDPKSFARLAGIYARIAGLKRKRLSPADMEKKLRMMISDLADENDRLKEEQAKYQQGVHNG